MAPGIRAGSSNAGNVLDAHRRTRAPGGTSALRKTVDCTITADPPVTISVPNVLGAMTLKGGAYLQDSRDKDRHLEDAAMLAATVEDADAIRDDDAQWTGSDTSRIAALSRNLPDSHAAWGAIPSNLRPRAEISLRILAGTHEP
ncbi:hypothetical protein [Luteipulveratus mongoliensis]|uniref:hypothetical protein n=1 Tax=Luteipulveratus mongoliensis TaxID=571913 RepID=UPI000698B5C9|nr:hypothetical protein [Luteipulveratus mongoliensis]